MTWLDSEHSQASKQCFVSNSLTRDYLPNVTDLETPGEGGRSPFLVSTSPIRIFIPAGYIYHEHYSYSHLLFKSETLDKPLTLRICTSLPYVQYSTVRRWSRRVVSQSLDLIWSDLISSICSSKTSSPWWKEVLQVDRKKKKRKNNWHPRWSGLIRSCQVRQVHTWLPNLPSS